MTILAMIMAFLVSTTLSGALSRYRGRFALLDKPNERSLHSKVTPRAGGLAIMAGLTAGMCLTWQLWWFEDMGLAAAGLGLVAAVSFADDVRALPVWTRLPVHFAAAIMLVCFAGFDPPLRLLPGLEWSGPLWLLQAFCILLAVWSVNLYNFMDGMDGFAGGMAVFGFGTLALLGYLAGSPAYAAMAVVVAAAAAGFLPFNFPPASLFMGDVGASSLGFLAAFFILLGERLRLFPLWIGLLVFSPFIVDATWTLVRRALKGRIPWKAHREHFYQRLVQSGWGHRRTTLSSYLVMLNCSLCAVLAASTDTRGVQGLLLGWITAVYLAIVAYVNARERRPLSKVEES
ncbi:MAG TPA: glycosyltransferase family 4 protein [Gammaproteobacteria bacterium]|nr:glycosyltransferase family 4 protein [Gammaproteobacteria bacterium]